MSAATHIMTSLLNFNKILAAYNVSFKTGVVAENDSSKYYQNPLYLLPTVETTDYTSDATDGYVFPGRKLCNQLS